MAECLRTLGIVGSDTECSGSCGVMEIVEQKHRNRGDGSRETLERIAKQIAAKYCPENAVMALPKCSKQRIW